VTITSPCSMSSGRVQCQRSKVPHILPHIGSFKVVCRGKDGISDADRFGFS
jgi:hypothetical protein